MPDAQSGIRVSSCRHPDLRLGFSNEFMNRADGWPGLRDRYRLPQAWEDASRWYRATYPPAKYPRRTLRNQSGVRAMHIANPSGGEWEGANLYETARGEVRVFVLGRGEKPAEASPPLPAPKAKQQPPGRR